MYAKPRCKYLIATLLLTSAQCAFAGSGAGVVYDPDNGGNINWSVGGFGINQNNTFTSSGLATPALTVKSGYASIYSGVGNTNTFGSISDTHTNLKVEGGTLDSVLFGGDVSRINQINGAIDVSGNGILRMHNFQSATLTNNVTKGITVSGGGSLLMQNVSSGSVTNTITGDVDVSGGGSLVMQNDSSGSVTNDIDGDVTVSGGNIYMYNPGSGSVTNDIDGDVTVSGGLINMDSPGSGSLTNTMLDVTVSGGG